MLTNLLEAIIGFSAGIAVGGAFVAFITVLKIIPRLIQLTHSNQYRKWYTSAIIFGLLLGAFLSVFSGSFHLPTITLVILGLFHGVFNGMLAAALAEVLHIFPVLFKRIRMEHFILWFITAIMFGKVFGSLFQWVYFVRIIL